MTLFPVALIAVAFGLRFQPPLMGLSLAGGLALGVALGVLGLRLTRFEVARDGLYYVPSAHLGYCLVDIPGRTHPYRYFTAGVPGTDPGAPVAMHLTPLTLVLIGTLAGYYVTYALGLLRWSRQETAAPP